MYKLFPLSSMDQCKKIILVLFLFFSSKGFSKEYFVLSSTNVKESNISKEVVRKIFLGNKLFWESGERILPVHLPVQTKAFKTFLSEVVQMDSSQFLSYWRRKMFSGRAHPPKQLLRDDSIIEYIQNNPQGIGVISSYPESKSEDIVVVEIH
ncbi:hypothetical protein [Halobacteriovorax sp. HLS]|uniref:hypothetical protein n=1 Tax=Halobacteriovorax sp. HLS TaxID=2234000 RepID=UPI000FD78D01|nr:hypothetical protein [Halobacteriovorax sp. HLS]